MRNAPAVVLGTMLGFLVCQCSLNPQPLPPDQAGDSGAGGAATDRADASRTGDAGGTFAGSGAGVDGDAANTPSAGDASVEAAAKDAATEDGATDAAATSKDAQPYDDATDAH